MSAFGSGPSNGQFWYGSQTNFPGFLYKKNVGVGGRRSTKMAPGGNITCNSSTYLYNKYKPGQGGVGASSISNRRAKNRLASVCGGGNSQCGAFYTYLGRYDNYTSNPNGYFPYPPLPPVPPVPPVPQCSPIYRALGTGVNGLVRTISINQTSGNVYAGGNQGLFMWNGINWTTIGISGSQVRSIAINQSNGNVYVGGNFTSAGGNTANYIAMWNPNTSIWSPLIDSGTSVNGVSTYVNAIAINQSNGNVYVGGNFTVAGGNTANYIAMWNPNTSIWSPLIDSGTSVNGITTTNSVETIAINQTNGNVYVGGNFTAAGGNNATNTAMWNPNTSIWSALIDSSTSVNGITGPGTPYVFSISINQTNGYVYMGGVFTSAGGNTANTIAMWNPNTSIWSPLIDSITGGNGIIITPSSSFSFVYSISIDQNNNVYASGVFTAAGGKNASNIAMWNPNTSIWSPLIDSNTSSNGTNNSIQANAINNLIVYLGGNFTSAGGVLVNDIASYGC